MSEPLLRSYLWAFCVVAAIPLGAIPLLCLQHMTGGAWGVIIRRPLEAAVRTLPLIAVMFLPIAFGAEVLYPWANGAYEPPSPKSMYLNLNAFWWRAVIYFAIWLILGLSLDRLSARQDLANPPGFDRRFRIVAAPGLLLYGLTITFASIDWVMSLEPEWFSSIYGATFGMGQILSAFTLAILIVLWHSDQPPLRGVLVSGHLRDLGSLLLAFVMIWAYLSVSQLLLIWIANLKEEAPYYTVRREGIWPYVSLTMVFAQFVLPFLVLLSRDGKRNPRALAWVAGIILGSRALELLWMVIPARPTSDYSLEWIGIIILPVLGGLWFTNFTYELKRRPLLPINVDVSVAEDHHG